MSESCESQLVQSLIVDVPSNEWLSANARLMPYARARRVAAVRLRAAMLARSARLRRMEGLVRVDAVIHGRVQRTFDPNNAADTTKPIVDGLRDAGVFEDDDYRHVLGPNHVFGEPISTLPVGAHRIVLTFTQIEGARS